MTQPIRAQITFKSGAQITADVEHLDTRRIPLTIIWQTPEEWTSAFEYIDPSEIVAIVLQREEKVGDR